MSELGQSLFIRSDEIDMVHAERRSQLKQSAVGILRDGEVFLMNRDEPASLDGRYFGPLPARSIVGRAEPLWIVEERR